MKYLSLLLVLVATSVTAMDMPCVNCSTIPPAAVGHADVRLRPTWQALKPTNVGAVRTTCSVSHFNYDDPLVHPGQPGKAHLHMFFGNTSTNAWTTPETIREVGNSTCRGGIANRSAYWVPAIIDSTDGAVIRSSGTQVYYKAGYQIWSYKDNRARNEEIQPPPAGIRVVAVAGKSIWGIRCNGGGRVGSFDKCRDGERQIQIEIRMPQCWDGLNLYKADQSHMRYPRRDIGGCPKSHPVALPEVTLTVGLPVPAGRYVRNWRLSSDRPEQLGGQSMHADWMNGWQLGLPEIWTSEIINQGLDGGSHHAGAGMMWF